MTTRLFWRVLDPPPRGCEKVLVAGDTGDPDLDGLIHIEWNGRLGDREPSGWRAVARMNRDPFMPDGWNWQPLAFLDIGGDAYPIESYPSERAIRGDVAEHWEELEAQAREWLDDATEAPAAADDAAQTERDRQANESLAILAGTDMLSSVAAVEPQELEPRDARVSEDMQRALAEAYLTAAQGVVDRLRATANEVERHINPRVSSRDLRADFTDRAAEIVSDVQAMMGNLSLNRLVRTARDADLAVRGRMP